MAAFLLPLWSFTQDTVELSKIYERLRFWQYRAKTLEEKQLCMCFLFVLYPFPAAAAAMPTILWLVCVFAKYQTHIWQLWTCWCIFCILTWIGLAPSAAKKCRDIIHSPGQKRYKLAASCPFGDEQRLVGAFSAGCKWLPFYPFHLPGKEATGHHLFSPGINSFNWILR